VEPRPGITSIVLDRRKGFLNGSSISQFLAPWLLYVDVPSSISSQFNRLRRALEQLVRACPGKVSIADCGILEALAGATERVVPGHAN
jgi:hypothetical protein